MRPAPWVSAFQEQRRSKVKAKSRLKPVGSSRLRQRCRYVIAMTRWLVGKHCAVYPNKMAYQVHHIRGRVGRLLLDERYWLPVSFAGHRWIHDHPEEARRKGWLADGGCWNRYEP